jgi:hypothetical protein
LTIVENLDVLKYESIEMVCVLVSMRDPEGQTNPEVRLLG